MYKTTIHGHLQNSETSETTQRKWSTKLSAKYIDMYAVKN